MAGSYLHPLDPLQNYYEKREQQNNEVVLICKQLGCNSRCTGSVRAARSNFKRHLLGQHPGVYNDDYVMTEEDVALDEDFDLVGKPNAEPLHFRKYICFPFDSVTKRARYVYCVLSKQLLDTISNDDTYHRPSRDIFLPKADQMTLRDFTGKNKPPGGYEMGHVIGLGLVRFSTLMHDVINCCSDVAFQHQQLNRGHWQYLEELVEGLLLILKVRLMAGTAGKLDVQTSSRAQVPRWWFMIILTSDNDDKNWRYTAYLFPNLECKEKLSQYTVTIPELEALLKMGIFPKIAADLKTDNKSERDPASFEEWVMQRWFPTAETSDEDEPIVPKKKKRPDEFESSDEDEA